MEPRDVSKLPSMEEFNKIKEALNLTDRQKRIFGLRYSKRWRLDDIAAELRISRDTVSKDIGDMRKKLFAVQKEELLAYIAKQEELAKKKEQEEKDKRAGA